MVGRYENSVWIPTTYYKDRPNTLMETIVTVIVLIIFILIWCFFRSKEPNDAESQSSGEIVEVTET